MPLHLIHSALFAKTTLQTRGEAGHGYVFIQLLISCILLAGCQAQEPPKHPLEKRWFQYSRLSKHPAIQNETKWEPLIDIITRDNIVYEYWTSYPEQYAAFERLNQLADETLLLTLLNHESPAVKVYALRCLSVRERHYFQVGLEKLRQDTTQVVWRFGCKAVEVSPSFFTHHDYLPDSSFRPGF